MSLPHAKISRAVVFGVGDPVVPFKDLGSREVVAHCDRWFESQQCTIGRSSLCPDLDSRKL
jgi:hypothetical protein